jgi:hypothetical protein
MPKKEDWRPIPGHPHYEVSSEGSIRRGERLLKPVLRENGYRYATLYPGPRQIAVHSLVLEAFVGPRPHGLVAAHWDNNPLNNRVENLRWTTQRENIRDQYRHGTRIAGLTHPLCKLTASQIKAIRALGSGRVPQRQLARMFGIDPKAVQNIVRGVTYANV